MDVVSGFVNMSFTPVVIEIDVDSRLQGFKSITKDDLARLFQKAKKTYCAGEPTPVLEITDADNFPNFMDIVLKIVNTSISMCKFSDSEKRAIVKPLLKGKLDYQNVNSYRPVSNLPILSKL